MGLFDKLTGTRRPPDGVTPASPDEVRKALLSLNEGGVPYLIRDGSSQGADLVAEWRLSEPAWQSLFIESQVARALRIRMRLDHREQEVRALEEQWEVERVGNPPRLQISAQYSRGPDRTVTRYWTIERGDDGRLRRQETFRFDSADLRNPLRDTVLKLGWGWRGVVFGKL
jgi:hypothetical protein